MFRRVWAEAREISAKDGLRELSAAFGRNDLFTFASAIAFQVFFALIPLMLFALALLSALGLEEIWTNDLATKLDDSASPAAFAVIDDTVTKVFKERQFFWLTLGAGLTIWKMSGATRSIMDVFDRIYDSDRERSMRERYAVSIGLSIASGLCILAAVAVVQLGPLLVDGPVGALRYVIAIVLLAVAIHLLVAYAPSVRHPAGWVSFGTLIVVVSWLGTSAVYTLYLTNFAQYGSIFGALATIIITFQYLYMAAIAFLAGAQIDGLLRERMEEDDAGEPAKEKGGAGWKPASSTS